MGIENGVPDKMSRCHTPHISFVCQLSQPVDVPIQGPGPHKRISMADENAPVRHAPRHQRDTRPVHNAASHHSAWMSTWVTKFKGRLALASKAAHWFSASPAPANPSVWRRRRDFVTAIPKTLILGVSGRTNWQRPMTSQRQAHPSTVSATADA